MNRQRSLNAFTLGSLCATIALALFFLPATSSADTTVQTGTVTDEISEGNFFSSPGELVNSFFATSEPVTGIQKFDPALGTLDSVSVYAEIDTAFSSVVYALNVIDQEFPHSVDFEVQDFFGGIAYTPGGGNTTFYPVLTDFVTFASCGGSAFQDPCDDFFEDGNMITEDSSVSSLSGFLASDFVGVGPVTALNARMLVPNDGLFTLDNVTEAEAELSASMTVNLIEVTYNFTPIPEPSTAVLLLTLAGCTTCCRRR